MRTRLWLTGLCLGYAAGVHWSRSRRRQSFPFAGKRVLITGGSRGLGLVMARQLAWSGAAVAILARDEKELRRALDQLPDEGAIGAVCDVGDREHVQRVVDVVAEQLGGLDVLIHNAGIIKVGRFDALGPEDFEESIRVHALGSVYATYAALPWLRAARDARIVNISSIGGKVPIPHLASYCTGKHALTGFSETLAAELRREGILVTTVCPSTMRTGSIEHAWFAGNARHEFAWFAATGSLPVLSMDAERAAAKILTACREGRTEVALSVKARLLATLHGVFPGFTAALLSLADRVLPSSSVRNEGRQGRDSRSRLSPGWLTHLSDEAADENNERPPGGGARTPVTSSAEVAGSKSERGPAT